MDKTCIINPATGRAVKIDGRIGKKLTKKETKDVTNTAPVEEKKKTTRKPATSKKETPQNDKEEAVKKLQAVLKRQSSQKKYDKDKDFKKAMGSVYSNQKFAKMTEKEMKEANEKNSKIKEDQNNKVVGNKTAKDVFKIVKDYMDEWNFENYKKSKLTKQSYLIKHQDIWSDVSDIVKAFGEDKLRKTLNQKDNKLLDEFKKQAKLEGTLERMIILS